MKNGYTPTEAAYSIAIDWLKAAYEEQTSDLEDLTANKTERRKVREAIRKLHSRLATDAHLDCLPLEEPED